MSVAVERILEEVSTLSEEEQEQLRRSLNGGQVKKKKEPLGKFVEPIPEPDQQGAMRWVSDHWREYQEQWIALDGYRLIAHGVDFNEVNAAAEADGAYLPMVAFIEREPEYLEK